jgi:hypothetical protein
MPFSEMLRRIALERTDVSEECSASMIRLTRIGGLGTTLAVTSNQSTLRRNIVILMMEVLRSSETTVLTRASQRHIPGNGILHSHRRENLKSCKEINYTCSYETDAVSFEISL